MKKYSLTPILSGIALCAALVGGACGGSDTAGSTMPEPVVEQPAEPVTVSIADAVASETRSADDKARDAARKPVEVLEFFGIESGMTVADLLGGTGYYSSILDQVVGTEGEVVFHNNEFVVNLIGADVINGIAAKLKNTTQLVAEVNSLGLEANHFDAVMMFLFYHDTYWIGADRAKLNKDIFAALKPGGVYAIIDHHAAEGAGDTVVKSLHRIEKKLVVAEILAAGFILDAESDMLRNEEPHTGNVFAKELRGKTDRFVIRFKKPL